MPSPWHRAVRWLGRTPNRTFALYPACVVLFELALKGSHIVVDPWGLPLLAWGYLQYRLVGRYRTAIGGGGPGPDIPPQRLVTSGPYRYTRNPMYLGHLIFMAGLALTFRSWLGVALLLFHVAWFHCRVLGDEARLKTIFGSEYADYARRVKRWVPGVA